MAKVYISITGFKLGAPWHAPKFWYHASRSMTAAQRADGCLSATARTIQGVHHTLTVWESRAHMMAYLRGPAHLAAMKAFPNIGTGKTLGYETQSPPAWPEARRLWEDQARDVSR